MADSPGALGQLSPVLLNRITSAFYWNNRHLSVPQLYLRLALVNKHFHEFFMSDPTWRDLDVHRVETGISRHYLRKKQQMSDFELELCGGFDFDKWVHPAFTLVQFNRLSLYTRAIILSDEHSKSHGNPYRVIYKTQCDPDLFAFASRALSCLIYATEDLRNDRRLLLRLAKTTACKMSYTSDLLKNDRELVFESLNGGYQAIKYCADALKDDKELFLKSIEKWTRGLEWASADLKNNLELATLAVSKSPWQLAHCSDELKNNFDFVMKAVQSDGSVVQYASSDLRDNWEIVQAAVTSSPLALKHVGEAYQLAIIRSGLENLDLKSVQPH